MSNNPRKTEESTTFFGLETVDFDEDIILSEDLFVRDEKNFK